MKILKFGPKIKAFSKIDSLLQPYEHIKRTEQCEFKLWNVEMIFERFELMKL